MCHLSALVLPVLVVMVGRHIGIMTAEDAHCAYLPAGSASHTTRVGRGVTLLLLTVLRLISALALVTLPDLAPVLSIRPLVTSAMVDWWIRTGLVCRTSDSCNLRCVQLTLTHDAEPIIGDTDPEDRQMPADSLCEGVAPYRRCDTTRG